MSLAPLKATVRQLGVLAVLGWCLLAPAFASVFVDTVPPEPHGASKYVTDLAHVLSETDKKTLNDLLGRYSHQRLFQAAIVILPATHQPLRQLGHQIMDDWGVGHHNNDGILIIMNIEGLQQHQAGEQVAVITGNGMASALPASLVQQLFNTRVKPALNTGYYYSGLFNLVVSLAGTVQAATPTQKPGLFNVIFDPYIRDFKDMGHQSIGLTLYKLFVYGRNLLLIFLFGAFVVIVCLKWLLPKKFKHVNGIGSDDTPPFYQYDSNIDPLDFGGGSSDGNDFDF